MNMTPLSGSNKLVVVGGGAAGMMAAGMAAQAGAHVTLLEQNGRLGKKLLITGKGRCNVTNDCPWQDVLQNVPTNPRFLYSALAGFHPQTRKISLKLTAARSRPSAATVFFQCPTGRRPFWTRWNSSCVNTMCASCRAGQSRLLSPTAA